jgi:hypothetical protein
LSSCIAARVALVIRVWGVATAASGRAMTAKLAQAPDWRCGFAWWLLSSVEIPGLKQSVAGHTQNLIVGFADAAAARFDEGHPGPSRRRWPSAGAYKPLASKRIAWWICAVHGTNGWLYINGWRDTYAKASLNSFVSRMPFRADAVVLYRFWHLADLRPRACLPELESTGVAIHDSHGTPFESGHFEQFCPSRFCGRHGRQFYCYYHFGNCDGSEVWKEPSSGLLLPCRWRGISAGGYFDYSVGAMTMPNRVAGRATLRLRLVLVAEAVKKIAPEFKSSRT